MRVDQIYTSISVGWAHLVAVYPRSQTEQRVGGERLAVPLLPGCAERSSSPHPSSRCYRRR